MSFVMDLVWELEEPIANRNKELMVYLDFYYIYQKYVFFHS